MLVTIIFGLLVLPALAMSFLILIAVVVALLIGARRGRLTALRRIGTLSAGFISFVFGGLGILFVDERKESIVEWVPPIIGIALGILFALLAYWLWRGKWEERALQKEMAAIAYSASIEPIRDPPRPHPPGR